MRVIWLGLHFCRPDGQASPSDISQSLAKGARMHGAKIFEGVCVTDIEVKDGRVVAVTTSDGRIACDKGRQLCRHVGQAGWADGGCFGATATGAASIHGHVKRSRGVTSDLPTLRDPDCLTYFKEEVGGLVMGGYEINPVAWAVDGIPDGFEFQLLSEDLDHFEQFMEPAMGRVPAFAEAGMKQLINGPESFTPDGTYIMGEAPEVSGFFRWRGVQRVRHCLWRRGRVVTGRMGDDW